MATFTTRTITVTRREWRIPAAEPWGAAHEEIGKAWAVAVAAYREAHGVPEVAAIPGDALRFRVEDDVIVIAFTVEEAER